MPGPISPDIKGNIYLFEMANGVFFDLSTDELILGSTIGYPKFARAQRIGELSVVDPLISGVHALQYLIKLACNRSAFDKLVYETLIESSPFFIDLCFSMICEMLQAALCRTVDAPAGPFCVF